MVNYLLHRQKCWVRFQICTKNTSNLYEIGTCSVSAEKSKLFKALKTVGYL